MANIVIHLFDTHLYKMSDAQRVRHMEERAKEQKDEGRNQAWSENSAPRNPFPEWLREIIKKITPKVRYDRMNQLYILSGVADDEVDDKLADLKAAIEEAVKQDPEKAGFFDTWHLSPRTYEIPESEAIEADSDD